ncbi:unnamed protein product [Ilex paraguariensis]|uniref:Ankyrin repeat protein n=1 Tax=Ilex paraguariensis TaxID=185542 RepID=A0ABC8SV73_9AQUA
MGADVNQKPFRGFATTASVREGHLEILEILLKAGASQAACEEALLEASCHGRARLVEVQDLKGSPCRADELFKSVCSLLSNCDCSCTYLHVLALCFRVKVDRFFFCKSLEC